MSTFIHPTAIVEEGAELGKDVHIGPFCTIGAQVQIGDRSRLESHVVVSGKTSMGSENTIYPFSMIGGPPQDLSHQGEDTELRIGNGNLFRESVTIHRGTVKDKALTTVGSHNYLMVACHIAHDCVVGDHIIMANQSAIAGHVELGNHIVVGGQSAILQRCRLGDYSFLGAGTVLRKDLPPYMAAKEFSDVSGPNLVGMRRNKFKADDIRVINEMYKLYYLSSESAVECLKRLEVKYPDNARVKEFVEFVRSSEIGVQR